MMSSMAADDTLNDGPLVGIRAMVLSPNLVGMVVAQFLADYGVEVIIVEPPGGCSLRSAAAWPAWARGSRTLSLDLRDEDGAACAATLAADADVVFEAFRPGVVERLGLDYDTLATGNPRLVYASVTAFGRDGPLARLKGYEGTVLAKIGGFDQFTVLVDRPGPAFPSVPYCSWSAASSRSREFSLASSNGRGVALVSGSIPRSCRRSLRTTCSTGWSA